ncbi:MAG: hypothetical protein OIF48_00175 [Silicimonas sp.]|nr:hypothetical protein [Silicimonas sp.]
MERIKSAAFSAVSVVLALAVVGVFAAFGFLVMGLAAVFGLGLTLIGALAPRNTPDAEAEPA